MTDRDDDRPGTKVDDTTKPARQDVPPPEQERVDDEVGGDAEKTTQRQE